MNRSERERVAAAIALAERGTTGRIAVRILHDPTVNAFERAKREFERGKLHRHQHGNAALILVAPKAKTFAVIGDTALHERVGDAFWQKIVDEMREKLAKGATADAIVQAVDRIGEALRTHFSASEGVS